MSQVLLLIFLNWFFEIFLFMFYTSNSRVFSLHTLVSTCAHHCIPVNLFLLFSSVFTIVSIGRYSLFRTTTGYRPIILAPFAPQISQFKNKIFSSSQCKFSFIQQLPFLFFPLHPTRYYKLSSFFHQYHLFRSLTSFYRLHTIINNCIYSNVDTFVCIYYHTWSQKFYEQRKSGK
jgi:hypothetical protein